MHFHTNLNSSMLLPEKLMESWGRSKKMGSTIFNYHTGATAIQRLSRDELFHLTVYFLIKVPKICLLPEFIQKRCI